MKKFLLTTAILLGLATSAFSQINYNLDDVMYLSNGSVIKGQIIEIIPNESYKIRTHNGSLIVVEQSDITKITKEEAFSQFSSQKSTKKAYVFENKRGYFGNVNAGIGLLNGADFNFTTAHGYQFNNYIMAGIQTGVSIHNQYGILSLPIMAYAKSNFTKSKIKPYTSVAMGYNLSTLREVDYHFGSNDYWYDTHRYRGFVFEHLFGVAFGKFTMSTGYKVIPHRINWGDNFGGITNARFATLNFYIGASF